MGTNFYHRENICECCNRYDEKHIGKNSYGWQFFFQGHTTPEIRSFKDWIGELAASGKIFDENGKEFSLDEFIQIVKEKQSQPNNHYDYCKEREKERGFLADDNWKDREGHPFSYSEFS